MLAAALTVRGRRGAERAAGGRRRRRLRTRALRQRQRDRPRPCDLGGGVRGPDALCPPGATTSRLLSNRRLVAIGIFSYSLYLVHAPVPNVLDVSLDRMGIHDDAAFALLVVVGLPVILASTYGFHLIAERPFMCNVRPTPHKRPSPYDRRGRVTPSPPTSGARRPAAPMAPTVLPTTESGIHARDDDSPARRPRPEAGA